MIQHISAGLSRLKSFYRGFISGIWFVRIVQQVIVTSGNIAESMFLLATLWVITNAVAHTLLTWFMPTQTIELFNYLAVIAFSALPELILIPTIIVCFTHWCVAVQRKDKVAYVWAFLYSAPTLIFAIMTVWAITSFVSTGGTHFVPADGMQLVIRCLSGYAYAVVNMLFKKLGEPSYASRFEEKDNEIVQLKAKIEELAANYSAEKQKLAASHSIEIENLTLLLKTQNEQVNLLAERASSLNRDVMDSYPIIAIDWLEKAKRTASIDEIIDATGLSRQKIQAAIRTGKLQKDNRNKELIRVSSVVEWLRNIPVEKVPNNEVLPADKPDQSARNTGPIPPTNGHRKDTQPLDLVPLEI